MQHSLLSTADKKLNLKKKNKNSKFRNMGLEYHMECFREANKVATFRMNNVEDWLTLAAKTIWQQHGH